MAMIQVSLIRGINVGGNWTTLTRILALAETLESGSGCAR
jgi:hypothetical protein